MSGKLGLVGGIVAGAVFVAVSTEEALTREAFDLKRHAISMLSLGDRGWIMAATFLVTGALVLGLAWSLRRVHGGRWAPLLVGGFGVGLLLAGLFRAPRGLGFPAGTPIDLQPEMTTTAILHSVGFNVAFGCLIASCFVFAKAYRSGGRGRVAAVCLAVGLGLPVLIALGMSGAVPAGVAFYLASVLGWAWLAYIAVQHLPAAASQNPAAAARTLEKATSSAA